VSSGNAAATAGAHEPWTVHAALLGAQTGFALFPIFGKLALTTIPALVLAAIRVVAAALLLEGARRIARARELEPADRRAVFLYGFLGVSLNQVLFILGLSLSTAINTTILTATIPIFTLAIAVLLGHEKLSSRTAVGMALATAGALWLLNVHRFDWRSQTMRGNLMLLANALAYSLYLVLSRPILARYDVLTIVSRVFLYGALPILLFTAPVVASFDPRPVTRLSWMSLAAVILFCTVFPYAANSWALARTHASRVAFYVFVQPVIASVLAVAVLGETITARTVVAALLIFAGLAVSLVKGRLSARPLP